MRCLNIIGLILNILGTVLLYFFGLPNRVDPTGAVNIVGEGVDEEEVQRAKIYGRLSALALSLLGIGFVLQLIAAAK